MITLITGGIKSGKSNFALRLAETQKQRGTRKQQGKLYFIATAVHIDDEMKERIRIHKKNRSSEWTTIEEPKDLGAALTKVPEKSIILIDCLTLWLGNLLSSKEEVTFPLLEKKIGSILSLIRKNKISAIFISNEVGSGIIPDNKLSRIYGDLLGKLNQIIAQSADEVYLMVSGISIKIKEKTE